MGNLISRFKNKDVRIILLGLDSAGKTTILYRLKLDDLVTTIPTIGFNVENIQYKDLHFTAWDIGSRDKIRPLFRHYYKGADAVVFVIDSHDPERLDELNYDVIKPAINAEELTGAVFLFLANKMDLPNTMSTEEISQKLGLNYLKHAWGILPVSAVSGEGLTAALDWLAVRLGSAQVRARNFTQQPPVSLQQPHSNTGSSLSSSSSNATNPNSRQGSKHDRKHSRVAGPGSEAPPQKPLILVNSKLVDNPSSPTPVAPVTGPAHVVGRRASSAVPMSHSHYSSLGMHNMHSHIRRSTPNVMNTFSSYSITQNMKEDLTRRKLSSISRSDIRKLSSGSLLYDAPGGRKFSTVSLMDSPTSAMNRRKHSSASLIIESPCYFRKLSTLSLSDTPPCGRKMSSISLQDNRTGGPSAGIPGPGGENRNQNLLSVNTGTFTPPIAKRQGSENSLTGFGSFSPIMANYVGFDGNRKDSDASTDSIPVVVSPSDHIQPHLRPLGLKKSPFLSTSGKYVVNEPPNRGLDYDDNLAYLLPERYRNLCLAAESLSGVSSGNAPRRESFFNVSNTDNADRTNANVDSSGQPTPEKKSHSHFNHLKKYSIFSRGGRLSKDGSLDSVNNSNSSSPKQSKRSHLDIFCSPVRKSHSHGCTKRKNTNRVVVPANGGKAGGSCSRAYSAIKCLFFRPSRREMQRETNSSSSEDERAAVEDGNNNEDV